MSSLRFMAVIVVFVAASTAWMILGSTLEYRTASLDQSLSGEVNSLWGPSGMMQRGPAVVAGQKERVEPTQLVDPLKSDIDVRFVHHNRYKGLLWFSTYTVQFDGTYSVAVAPPPAVNVATSAPAGDSAIAPATGMFIFRLPCEVETLSVLLDGKPAAPRYSNESSHTLLVDMPDGGQHVVAVRYEARGRDRWAYTPVWDDQARPCGLRHFTLTATTNFADIDYSKGSVSPETPAVATADGMRATWHYDTSRTTKWLGIEMPRRADAGPIAARMSFFAPVSLFFFFTTLFTIVVLKKIPLHPMHYLFIAGGFFAFHILLAYMVDLVSIHTSFWACAAVSVFLVVSYMRLVAGVKFAVTYVALAQLVYLVGFSYAFFWAGKTGLTITVGAIATLFVLMQATGRINWQDVFKARSQKAAWPGIIPPPVPSESPNQ